MVIAVLCCYYKRSLVLHHSSKDLFVVICESEFIIRRYCLRAELPATLPTMLTLTLTQLLLLLFDVVLFIAVSFISTITRNCMFAVALQTSAATISDFITRCYVNLCVAT